MNTSTFLQERVISKITLFFIKNTINSIPLIESKTGRRIRWSGNVIASPGGNWSQLFLLFSVKRTHSAKLIFIKATLFSVKKRQVWALDETKKKSLLTEMLPRSRPRELSWRASTAKWRPARAVTSSHSACVLHNTLHALHLAGSARKRTWRVPHTIPTTNGVREHVLSVEYRYTAHSTVHSFNSLVDLNATMKSKSLSLIS